MQEQNLAIVEEQGDLHAFLFGASRSSLLSAGAVLQGFQQGRCFYCNRDMRGKPDVDHFVPWTIYQLDLGHNFVLAHRDCNQAKRDRLAAERHLSGWVQRNRDLGEILGDDFDRLGVPHNLQTTHQIAWWAYESTTQTNGLTWVMKQDLEPLTDNWRSLFG